MANLNFSDDVFNNEMKVIREERRQRIEDNPKGLLYETMLKSAWNKSQNYTSVIGKMADLKMLQADDLRRWYRQWYAPNNATLVVVGDVEPQKVFAQAQQYFGNIPRHDLPARPNISESETQKANHDIGLSRTASAKIRRQIAIRVGYVDEYFGRTHCGAVQ